MPSFRIGYRAFLRSCPPGAIRVDRQEGIWSINRFDCVQCESCVNACPKKCLKMAAGYTQPETEKAEERVEILKKQEQ